MSNQVKNIAILGSTGSIGTQTLDVIRWNSNLFKAFLLTAHSNADLLISQAIEFVPEYAIICNQSKYQEVKEALAHLPIQVLAGHQAIIDTVTHPEIAIVLTAMVGFAGLEPTIAAIKAGKDIALANKETLVVAGDIITALAKQNGVQILPVDSEHSAIFQSLVGEEYKSIEKLIITASGGPFRGRGLDFLANVTREDALKHPNWVMGAKITIDSASLMNKGLEVIEAKWLFDVEADQIEVVVHPQSIIHSLVQFRDGSIKAQLGLPDMKLPIQYALTYPNRIETNFKRFSFTDYPNLTFEKPDMETFRNLSLAYAALKQGGNMPCIINAANEIAVAGFLDRRIGFLTMSGIIEECMQKINFIANPTLTDYLNTDKETRIFAQNYIQQLPSKTLQF
ncbi:1-deoxy-D-xylulose-5-phosphate reductoisomerase [Mucilaginibacter rubeus]|uniref:1-deoxy-D-xylulose 5-phosphate reductoisomerase n=1 Tax=Mucilaginibacter rubeus TaxID=2027860 RepID=A0AAE6JE09_9SPHI|nr:MULTISPECIES: 1-deoxy-D-xylulose-5-phosphate reductoisomerase [Mucilaginibacter]QEM03883.1 1-deoxy-D-xylulose-5-phosphate reductoisomerase [Mucilaginibacter rubeus]QEM16493.1 1-deoxy-D-xylulose-5-phosphate reductoisomerase [Mucilaginibacter gossypii]QTE40739.1 1-deoxy-D-xylulose-5-phosphate reductoisomerase [Mucilaginibacter rubeus]QTE47341.1 1-deoxy-D-xylulose-5-phosphate reductoisomerase [Mucilaginibacter rubeus]QTE58734.1 1-deoxy-D-xylulose-5-phosphate reductoisomerase [Mucilaginibacter 